MCMHKLDKLFVNSVAITVAKKHFKYVLAMHDYQGRRKIFNFGCLVVKLKTQKEKSQV